MSQTKMGAPLDVCVNVHGRDLALASTGTFKWPHLLRGISAQVGLESDVDAGELDAEGCRGAEDAVEIHTRGLKAGVEPDARWIIPTEAARAQGETAPGWTGFLWPRLRVEPEARFRTADAGEVKAARCGKTEAALAVKTPWRDDPTVAISAGGGCTGAMSCPPTCVHVRGEHHA